MPFPFSPIGLTAFRTTAGVLLLLFFLLIKRKLKSFFEIFWHNLLSFIGIGIGLFAIAYLFQYWGLIYTSAINQSIISNTQIFWVVVFNYFIFKQKPKWLFVLGLGIAFIGVLLILLNDLASTKVYLLGDLISIIAYTLWGGYTAISKSLASRENPLFVTTGIFLAATFFLIPLSYITNGIPNLFQTSSDILEYRVLSGICMHRLYIPSLELCPLESCHPVRKYFDIEYVNPSIGNYNVNNRFK